MLRFLTAGESHGKGITVIIDGMPANVPISTKKIQFELQKRSKDFGRGGRGLIETDRVQILSGVRFGKTIGSPIALFIENKDFKNWEEKMSIEDKDQSFKDSIAITRPRPGHADLVGVQKYGFDDVRNVLERASARETVGRVAAGSIFKQMLEMFGIEIASHTVQIGRITLTRTNYDFEDINKVYDLDPEIRCIDKITSDLMKQEIRKARANKDTLGGVVEIWAVNVPPGLGSYVQYDRRIDGQISQALMSIPSVKAVEIGTGIDNARLHGSKVQDEIFYLKDKGYYRKTNRAGGIEGGVTNGMSIVCRAYHKPISTIYKPLQTVDIRTKQQVKATVERSDICVVPRAGVISESMLAFIIAQNILEKSGKDTVIEIKKSVRN